MERHLTKPHQGCYFFPSLHTPARTERQDTVNICFLNLRDARSPLSCNTQSVSFIKSCPGKCLIHFCRSPAVGWARALKTLGSWRTIVEARQQLQGAALATCANAREQINVICCLLVSLEQKHLFAWNRDAVILGTPDRKRWACRRWARSRDCRTVGHSAWKALAVQRADRGCGTRLLVKGEPSASPTGYYTGVPPHAPGELTSLFSATTKIHGSLQNLITGNFHLSSVAHVSNCKIINMTKFRLIEHPTSVLVREPCGIWSLIDLCVFLPRPHNVTDLQEFNSSVNLTVTGELLARASLALSY